MNGDRSCVLGFTLSRHAASSSPAVSDSTTQSKYGDSIVGVSGFKDPSSFCHGKGRLAACKVRRDNDSSDLRLRFRLHSGLSLQKPEHFLALQSRVSVCKQLSKRISLVLLSRRTRRRAVLNDLVSDFKPSSRSSKDSYGPRQSSGRGHDG